MSPAEDRAAPMAAAPFVWRADGRPDWGSMWTSFCDLALHGGPPHRGSEQALRGADAGSDLAIVAEIRRGIWETTGLFAEPHSPGWLAVTCESRAMAEWLAAAIVLENVEARVEADRLLLPAGPRFRLENEVKSIVTVVAKTHHYGAMHAAIAPSRDQPDDAPPPHGFRCVSCGLEVHVSRAAAAAELDATCPIDGTRMVGQGRVTAPRGASFGRRGPVRVAVAGPGDGPTVLIDALRRRYGRRRAVVVSPARALDVNDHAIDLFLVEVGEGGAEPGPETVDATVGVLSAPAVADALRRGDRDLQIWRLLVVNVPRGDKTDRSRLEEDTRERRGRGAVVFVDLATDEGVDVIMAWLQRELGLSPWRERR
jgi:hypothetical protein